MQINLSYELNTSNGEHRFTIYKNDEIVDIFESENFGVCFDHANEKYQQVIKETHNG